MAQQEKTFRPPAVTVTAVYGLPAEALLSAGQDADMIVVGSLRHVIPLLARHLARLAADADRGVGEEPPEAVRSAEVTETPAM